MCRIADWFGAYEIKALTVRHGVADAHSAFNVHGEHVRLFAGNGKVR